MGEVVLVVGQDVQGEVVGRVLGQLVLPGVEQLGTQQGDQGHGQQDQAEGQGLPGSRQWVAQQLAKAQAPSQRAVGKQAPQAAQAEQQ
ncbi:hypothetical protein D9M71_815960 [compost metagenome]